MSEHISNFNDIIKILANKISLECPNSIIANNIGHLNTIIKQYPTKILELFIIHVLPDQEKIELGNDDYFLNKTYDNVSGGNNAIVKQIFEYKNIWTKLSRQTKNDCIEYLKILCLYSSQYFLEKYK